MANTIPQYIRDAVRRRTESAYRYFTYDRIISEWCEKNQVDTEFINGNSNPSSIKSIEICIAVMEEFKNSIENDLIPFLETLRVMYNKTQNKQIWKELIRWLPESWLQTRTVTLNYENLLAICRHRRHHKATCGN